MLATRGAASRGLAKLKESGVLHWRRAVPVVTEGGGFILRQARAEPQTIR
jgi:hypothetical protein